MVQANPNDSRLELAHVLFIDIVGYSKRLINEQTALVQRLNELVLQTEQCRTADAAGKSTYDSNAQLRANGPSHFG